MLAWQSFQNGILAIALEKSSFCSTVINLMKYYKKGSKDK
jgi:hypothetical protein